MVPSLGLEGVPSTSLGGAPRPPVRDDIARRSERRGLRSRGRGPRGWDERNSDVVRPPASANELAAHLNSRIRLKIRLFKWWRGSLEQSDPTVQVVTPLIGTVRSDCSSWRRHLPISGPPPPPPRPRYRQRRPISRPSPPSPDPRSCYSQACGWHTHRPPQIPWAPPSPASVCVSGSNVMALHAVWFTSHWFGTPRHSHGCIACEAACGLEGVPCQAPRQVGQAAAAHGHVDRRQDQPAAVPHAR
eukprot:9504116-Pyramimonas_sp.AAC.4